MNAFSCVQVSPEWFGWLHYMHDKQGPQSSMGARPPRSLPTAIHYCAVAPVAPPLSARAIGLTRRCHRAQSMRGLSSSGMRSAMCGHPLLSAPLSFVAPRPSPPPPDPSSSSPALPGFLPPLLLQPPPDGLARLRLTRPPSCDACRRWSDRSTSIPTHRASPSPANSTSTSRRVRRGRLQLPLRTAAPR